MLNLSLLRGGSEPTILGTSVGTLWDLDVSIFLSFSMNHIPQSSNKTFKNLMSLTISNKEL